MQRYPEDPKAGVCEREHAPVLEVQSPQLGIRVNFRIFVTVNNTSTWIDLRCLQPREKMLNPSLPYCDELPKAPLRTWVEYNSISPPRLLTISSRGFSC